MTASPDALHHVEDFLDWLVNRSDQSPVANLERGDALDLEYKRGAVNALKTVMENALGGEEFALRNPVYRDAKAYSDVLSGCSQIVARFRDDFPESPTAVEADNVIPFRRPA
jgi:hypothetical protein